MKLCVPAFHRSVERNPCCFVALSLGTSTVFYRAGGCNFFLITLVRNGNSARVLNWFWYVSPCKSFQHERLWDHSESFPEVSLPFGCLWVSVAILNYENVFFSYERNDKFITLHLCVFIHPGVFIRAQREELRAPSALNYSTPWYVFFLCSVKCINELQHLSSTKQTLSKQDFKTQGQWLTWKKVNNRENRPCQPLLEPFLDYRTSP